MVSNLILKLRSSNEVINTVSSFARTIGKSIWGFSIPTLLSINYYGIYSLVQITTNIITQLSLLGTPQTIMRETDRDKPLLGFLLHSFLLLLPVTVIALVISKQVNIVNYGILIFISSLGYLFYNVICSWAKGKLRFTNVLIGETIGSTILLVSLGFILFTKIKYQYNYNIILLISIEISAITLISLTIIYKDFRDFFSEFTTKGIKKLIPSVYSVGFFSLLDIVLWKRLEVFFLERSPSGLIGVAVFSLAILIANTASIFPNSILESWYPNFAHLYKNDRPVFYQQVKKRFITFLKIYGVYAILLIPFIRGIFPLLFNKYLPWMNIIMLIISIRIISGIADFFSSLLYSTKREKDLLFPVVLSTFVALSVNLIFTVRLGISGVIIAYAVTRAVLGVSTILAYSLEKIFHKRNLLIVKR